MTAAEPRSAPVVPTPVRLPLPAAVRGCSTVAALLARPGLTPVLLAGSRDPNAKLTVLLLDRLGPVLVVKIATTLAAGRAVRAEAARLAALQAAGLGPLSAQVPRPLAVLDADGLPALVTTALAGVPMSVTYHEWRHTARRRRVHADLAAAGRWLATLQRLTASAPRPVGLFDTALAGVERRFGHQPALRAALGPAAALLAAQRTPRTAVHGDYWFGNVLLAGSEVAGVVDWEASIAAGEPLRDVARFAMSYCLYLDRHVRPGARIAGHPGLRATGWGAGLRHAVRGGGWLADEVTGFCADALARLGADPAAARALLLAGIADVAATADHVDFARAHLNLLSGLEVQP